MGSNCPPKGQQREHYVGDSDDRGLANVDPRMRESVVNKVIFLPRKIVHEKKVKKAVFRADWVILTTF